MVSTLKFSSSVHSRNPIFRKQAHLVSTPRRRKPTVSARYEQYQAGLRLCRFASHRDVTPRAGVLPPRLTTEVLACACVCAAARRYSRGMMPWSASCSRVLLCWSLSCRTEVGGRKRIKSEEEMTGRKKKWKGEGEKVRKHTGKGQTKKKKAGRGWEFRPLNM